MAPQIRCIAFVDYIRRLAMPESGLNGLWDHSLTTWCLSAVLSPFYAIHVLRWKWPQIRCIASLEDIGSLAMPESGLRPHIDHFWNVVGVCPFFTAVVWWADPLQCTSLGLGIISSMSSVKIFRSFYGKKWNVPRMIWNGFWTLKKVWLIFS